MKLGLKKGWKSIVPLRLRGKSATRFCIFPKVKSAGYGPGNTPVYLNVYDLTPMNGYVYWAGLGIFHSGVEVHGVEYAFGAHDYPTSGVFEVEPRQCPGFKFRKSILIGTTCLDPIQVREFMERHSASYNGDTYHLIVKNCNHFCKDICYKLTGRPIPKWVNRLAKIGSICNCILPEALKISAVRHDPNYQEYDSEKRRLRSAFNCLSSISMRQRQLSTSSMFLHSPLKGCLPPWELRRSTNRSLKDRSPFCDEAFEFVRSLMKIHRHYHAHRCPVAADFPICRDMSQGNTVINLQATQTHPDPSLNLNMPLKLICALKLL